MDEHDKLIINSISYWNDRFSPSGSWEQKNGRVQTRTFSECFNRIVNIPLKDFSLLDVGCALGDALPVFRKKYPGAMLSGCDFSEISIERCKNEYGAIASFFTSSIENVNGKWDVIYCSNVLEHFSNPVELSEKLLGSCRILYLMTPYLELENGKPFTPVSANNNGHIHTFYKDSFNPLLDRCLASRINTYFCDCPPAWGWKFRDKVWHIKNTILNTHDFKNIFRFPKQIIFEIHKNIS